VHSQGSAEGRFRITYAILSHAITVSQVSVQNARAQVEGGGPRQRDQDGDHELQGGGLGDPSRPGVYSIGASATGVYPLPSVYPRTKQLFGLDFSVSKSSD